MSTYGSSRVTYEDLTRRLAVNVRYARNNARLTLRVTAIKVKMHWRHLQKIEAGEVNVTLHMLVRLGEVLDVDPASLIREPPPGVVAKVARLMERGNRSATGS